jgi:hypothetical protein
MLQKIFVLSEDEIDIFTNLDFMEMIVYHDYSTSEYGKALAHLCFNNK